jgi:glycogen operon protein
LRNRQIKNFLTVTLVSLGVPMILMGDEVRHSEGGNNNAYCQDNEISWFDWTGVSKHADVHRFLQMLIQQRLQRTVEYERQRMTLTTLLAQANKAWHGVKLFQPDWGDDSHSLALGAELRQEGLHVHLILNAYWGPLTFELPKPGAGGAWKRWIDTALDSPNDIVPLQSAPTVAGDSYRAEARSVVLLIADGKG